MKTSLEFEVGDQETIVWNIRIEMSSYNFLMIAGQVYQALTGMELPQGTPKLENKKSE